MPFFGLARFVVAVGHPAGARDIKLAIFERGDLESLRFSTLTDSTVGSSWKPMIRVRERNGESTNIYIREEGKNLNVLITSLDGGEATFVQVRLEPRALIRFVDEHGGEAIGSVNSGTRPAPVYNGVMTRFLVLLGLTALSLPAQEWAKQKLEQSPRHREWVTVKHDDRSVETFVAYPEAKGKAPVILVIHEIFGMTDWVQEVADEFAAAGYIAIAPDLLSGMGSNGGRSNSFDQSGAMEAVSHLNPDQITADLNAAADYALKLPAASKKLFVVGFCWGGGQSFRFATNRTDLSDAFVFYGPPPEKDAMTRIKAPVYGFYGGNDARIDATIPLRKRQCRGWAKLTTRWFMKERATASCARASSPMRSQATQRLAAKRGSAWRKLLGGIDLPVSKQDDVRSALSRGGWRW